MTIVYDACTIVQASFTIVTYDRQNIFIIQATGEFNADKLLCQMNNLKEQLALGHWLFNSSAPMITITTLFMVGCLLCRKEVLPPGQLLQWQLLQLSYPPQLHFLPWPSKSWPPHNHPLLLEEILLQHISVHFPFKCFLWPPPPPKWERYPITIYIFLLQWNLLFSILSNSSSPS